MTTSQDTRTQQLCKWQGLRGPCIHSSAVSSAVCAACLHWFGVDVFRESCRQRTLLLALSLTTCVGPVALRAAALPDSWEKSIGHRCCRSMVWPSVPVVYALLRCQHVDGWWVQACIAAPAAYISRACQHCIDAQWGRNPSPCPGKCGAALRARFGCMLPVQPVSSAQGSSD